MPSGQKKTVNSLSRAVVGIVAGGGRIDKPLLKVRTIYCGADYTARRQSSQQQLCHAVLHVVYAPSLHGFGGC